MSVMIEELWLVGLMNQFGYLAADYEKEEVENGRWFVPTKKVPPPLSKLIVL